MFGLHLFKLGKHGTSVTSGGMSATKAIKASHAAPKPFVTKASKATTQYFYPSQAGSRQAKGVRKVQP